MFIRPCAPDFADGDSVVVSGLRVDADNAVPPHSYHFRSKILGANAAEVRYFPCALWVVVLLLDESSVREVPHFD